MKSIGKLLIATGVLSLVWSIYIFIKYLGLGGNNSYAPYTALGAIASIIIGTTLMRRKYF
jgi:hypothetical protein